MCINAQKVDVITVYEFVCHTGTCKNLFTSNISVTTLIEFEGLPAKTWKILREIFLELP